MYDGRSKSSRKVREMALLAHIDQVSARSPLFFFVFGCRLNRGNRVIFLFHHNNVPAHVKAIVVTKLMEIGFQLVSHPPIPMAWLPQMPYIFEEMAGETILLFKRRSDCRNEWLLFRLAQILLFGRNQKAITALNEM